MVVFLPNKSSDKTFTNTSEDDKEERHFSDDDENWTKLQDIASRRRIQNRISQRKRRRRLRENSLSQSNDSSVTSSPPRSNSTPKLRPEVTRSKTETFLERPNLHSHSRSRSISMISDFSLDGDNTPTQRTTMPLLPNTPEPQMPSTPPMTQALMGNWDQQFFDQAFMSDMPSFEGGTVDFLYSAGEAGMFASPAYPSSNYSPAMTFSSEGSIDGLDKIHIDPKLTNDYDDLFNTNIPFNGGNDLCMTPPQFDFTASPLPTKSFPFPAAAQNNGYPTPPSSLHSHNSSLQSTPESLASSTFTDISGNTALHLAAEKGHMGIVQLLLDTGIDINAANKDSQSCLHIAVDQDNVAMSGLLMEKGALADAKNGLGQNALHIAVEKGNKALVGLVLDYASDVDARDCLGQTAFHRAVAMGWEEIVRLMLLRGVNSQAKVGRLATGGQHMMG